MYYACFGSMLKDRIIEHFHSRSQHLCIYATKKIVCIRKEFNSPRAGLEHQHGCRFIVSGHHAFVTSCENTLYLNYMRFFFSTRVEVGLKNLERDTLSINLIQISNPDPNA